MHGAKGGRPPIHGRYAKHFKNGRLRTLLEGIATDKDLHDQSERLKVLDVLLISKLETLGESGSATLWQEACDELQSLKSATTEGKAKQVKEHLANLESILTNGAHEQTAEKNARELIDQMARVSAVQIRLEYSRAMAVSGREMATLMARIEHGIRQFIHDPAERANFLNFITGEVA